MNWDHFSSSFFQAPKMKHNLFIFFLVAAVIACSSLLPTGAAEADQKETNELPARNRLGSLARVFDFDTFVALYRKEYANIVERLNRMRLFLAKAIVVFVKGCQYLKRLDSYYLAINEMSDWTPGERAKYHENAELSTLVSAEEPIKVLESGSDEFVAPSEEEVKQIMASSSDLDRRSARKKRSLPHDGAPLPRRSLTIDQLMKDPKNANERERVSSKLVVSVPSNNPDYEPPQQISEGIGNDDEDDRDKMPPIGGQSDEVSKIDSVAALLAKVDSLVGEEKELVGEQIGSVGEEEADKTKVFLDHRDSGCISPVKDQRKCGSCYAFAVLAVYEYLHCKQTGQLVSFAEQFVVDCGPKLGLHECNGGRSDLVANFANKFGFELGTYYPYRARFMVCPYDYADGEKGATSTRTGHTRIKHGRMVLMYMQLLFIDQVEYYLKRKGPLAISIRTNKDFNDYGGGVHRLEKPKKDSAHAMTLVGHGVEEGEEYWLIRNSYGTNWGEKGYYKLSKDNVDKDALYTIGFIEADFEKNDQHSSDAIRKRVLANRKFFERLFNL